VRIESIRTTQDSAGPVTITDVARHAGVAPSTVSYVLTGKRSISGETRERVEASIAVLGYRPHAGARALRSSRTGIIGLVMPFRSGGREDEAMTVVEGVLHGARDHGMNVLLLTADRGAEEIEAVVSGSMVDGLILMQIGLHDVRVPFIEQMLRPAVLIGKPDDATELPYVDFDFEGAGRLCAEHLLKQGHRDIAFLGRPSISYERQEGYAMRARHGAAEAVAGFDLALPSEPCEPTEEGVDYAVSRLFSGGTAPTGLIVHNGVALVFLSQALRRVGRTLGVDVSAVAICADEHAMRVSPPVSNVGVPEYELGARAVKVLSARLDATTAGRETWLPASLTIRDGEDVIARPGIVSGGDGQEI
jgi:DNA-binding LacI/PurR family transcriptional regulator